MKFESIIAVFKALDDAGVRFLVAGGVAVNLHGYARMTQDLDLVVELSPSMRSPRGPIVIPSSRVSWFAR